MIVFRLLCLLSVVGIILFFRTGHAQAQWRDAATGQVVASGPILAEKRIITATGADIVDRGVKSDPGDPNRAFDPETGRNFVRDPATCRWKDAATGQVVTSGPILSEKRIITATGADIVDRGVKSDPGDPNRAFDPETGRNFVRMKSDCTPKKTIVAPTPPPTETPPPKEHAMAPPRGAAFNIGNIGVAAATLAFDPAHFSPSVGANGDQWGSSSAGLFPLYDKLGVELGAGYHHVSSSGPGLDNWTAGGSLVWREPDWRFGPSFGFQSNSAGLVSTQTYNYGPYVEWFASPYLTLSTKGGGFSSSPAPDGFYVSGGIKFYPTPNFVFNGAIDYTRFTSLPSSDETDFTIGAEYLFSETTPISFFGGYTRNQFSPGTFHVNTVLFGLKLYLNGDGATTLVDRQRTGTLGSSSIFAPLKLKF